jgi:hypothetical protein
MLGFAFMGSVREILERQPPPILYHYTTAAGLLGILKSKEIWATHTQYLNDAREFRHAVSLVKTELEAMLEGARTSLETAFLKEMQEAVSDSLEGINVCVCSFSEVGDQLSQWRAYGGGAGGFSIGFLGRAIKAATEREHSWLVPCLYDEEPQRVLVQNLLQDVLDELKRRGAYDRNIVPNPRGGNLVAYLNRYAPILKHKSFEEEREWRIISRPLMCSLSRFDFRAGTSMLIPYYRMALSADDSPISIQEIIVGPTPHKAQSRRSLQSLLLKCELEHTRVRNTAGPFRSW